MSGTSNQATTLSAGKKSPLPKTLTMENEPPSNNTRATKILFSHLMLLYRGYTVHKYNVLKCA